MATKKNDATALDALFDAWDKTTGGGRDEAAARKVCDEYVAAHPDDFSEFEAWSLEECVAAVDVFRDAAATFRSRGLNAHAVTADSNKLKLDVWLLHRFEPQDIGGAAKVKVRIPNG
ncbi:hypothetical protein [Mycolicibacterium palauense]|uniref:hypothetical protein n=1 Tax=Mycolicibacterium palauense TaxID=2034511 RepID=UPI000BFECEA0|nr:hypothetical protein [Mycolicibacterium palauense]